jgi:hypothetical protein
VLLGWAETGIRPFRTYQIAVLAVGLAASMFVGKLLERGIALRASHAWSHLTEANANSHAGSGKLSEFARSLRTSYPLVRAYRVFARTILPFLFFLAVFVLFALGLKRLVFDIRSASGQVCEPTAADKLKPIQRDSAASFEFDTNKVCYATGFKVQRDQAYAVDFVVKAPLAGRQDTSSNNPVATVSRFASMRGMSDVGRGRKVWRKMAAMKQNAPNKTNSEPETRIKGSLTMPERNFFAAMPLGRPARPVRTQAT